MKEYLEDGYDIDPFMPGISPVGKATPSTKTVNIPTPYVPSGTGYKYLRSKPGFRKVNDALKNQIIAEYDVGKPIETDEGRKIRGERKLLDIFAPEPEPRRSPYLRAETEPGFKQGYKQIPTSMEVTPDIDFKTHHAMGEILDTFYPPYSLSDASLLGQYDPANKVVIIPEKGPDYPNIKLQDYAITDYEGNPEFERKATDVDGRAIRRHEFGHVVDHESGKAKAARDYPIKSELPANIAEEKSIRKGLDKTMKAIPGYEERIIEAINRRHLLNMTPDVGWKKKAEASMNEKGNFPEAQAKQDSFDKQRKPYKLANKVLQKIPSKPGNFTGRVPTFGAIGANLVDMIMMSPDYQRAKEDSTFGIGEAERERLEAAYQYGL